MVPAKVGCAINKKMGFKVRPVASGIAWGQRVVALGATFLGGTKFLRKEKPNSNKS